MLVELKATAASFDCPECGKPFGSTIDHLQINQKFGAWHCDHCGVGVRGIITEHGPDIQIDKSKRKVKTLVLLRLNDRTHEPIHIVVPGMMFVKQGVSIEQELANTNKSDAYFYHEHTCPSNYLGFPIKVGNDTDPHGVFLHQQTILMPDNYDGSIQVNDVSGDYHDIKSWVELFSSLRV